MVLGRRTPSLGVTDAFHRPFGRRRHTDSLPGRGSWLVRLHRRGPQLLGHVPAGIDGCSYEVLLIAGPLGDYFGQLSGFLTLYWGAGPDCAANPRYGSHGFSPALVTG